jgi:phosphoglycolate phosphatase-like HAD superfamily hydrolase
MAEEVAVTPTLTPPVQNKKNGKPAYVAIDAGGVLFHKNEGVDQTNRERTPIKGALEAVTALKMLGHRLYLVSFAGRKTAQITLSDMGKHYPDLFDGIYFVKNKLEKVALCHHLGADAMIDDTPEVHGGIAYGMYHGKAKAIGPIPTVLRVMFVGDFDEDQVLVENSVPPHNAIAVDWGEVFKLCEHLTHTHQEKPDYPITRYVYPEFCVPAK